MSIKLIVGLRNPGANYQPTRHNAGEWFVDAVMQAERISLKIDKKLRGELAPFTLNSIQSMLFLPLSFMNQSGECVRAVCQFYRILPHEILVAHDELDLPPGSIRLKTGGGHGGHNGLRDMIAHLNSNEFHRLRIGIGHPGHKDKVLDYVLGKPSQSDKQLINEAIARALVIMPTVLAGQFALAMSKLNT